jgi:hypothetical protein
MEERIITEAKRMDDRFYSVGYLNMDVRFLSGEITEHVKITKDKFGDASLNLLLLIEVLKNNNGNILTLSPGKARKFCIAIIARIFKVLILINKMHQDYMLEFQDDLKELSSLMAENSHLMKLSIQRGLDINWLAKAEIPEDISEIYKSLRKQGYLSTKTIKN